MTLDDLLTTVRSNDLEGSSGIQLVVSTGPGRPEEVISAIRVEYSMTGAPYLVLDVTNPYTLKRKKGE